jgi:hypothetical protein
MKEQVFYCISYRAWSIIFPQSFHRRLTVWSWSSCPSLRGDFSVCPWQGSCCVTTHNSYTLKVQSVSLVYGIMYLHLTGWGAVMIAWTQDNGDEAVSQMMDYERSRLCGRLSKKTSLCAIAEGCATYIINDKAGRVVIPNSDSCDRL